MSIQICNHQLLYNYMFKKTRILFQLFIFLSIIITSAQAQEKSTMYRIAKISIDSNHIQAYHQALKEQMQAAIQNEPGVLSYTALANKNKPTEITIIEVYANMDAYQAHIQTPHFKKYKQMVNGWVLSLELLDQTLIAAAKQSSF